MPDESWAQIYAARPRLVMPAAPLVARPPIARPQCPEHCSGRHEVEAVMTCAHCGSAPYQVVAHEWVGSEGHYFYTLDPLGGAVPAVGTPTCCGQAMVRRARR